MITEKLTHSELLVMKTVWDMNGNSSLSEIVENVNGNFHKDWKPQTVSTFLKKLVQKGYLKLKRKGGAWVYEVLISAADYQSHEVANFVKFWGGDSGEKMMSALFREHKISKKEIEELRRILDELDNDTVL